MICFALTLAIGASAVVGGVGGSLYFAYFACVLILSIGLVYFADAFFNPFDRPGHSYSDHVLDVFVNLSCSVVGPADNLDGSLLTFVSRGAMWEGIVMVLGMRLAM